MYNHTLSVLKNGLQLVVVPMPQVESATVVVGVGAGSRFESRQTNGLFHFLEHMAFKGTKTRPHTRLVTGPIESVGGEFNAYTSKEMTAFWVKIPARHLELVFDILSDIVLNPLFKAEEIAKEKGVIIEEINMYEDLPMRRVWEHFERLIYGDTPMGWGIAGTKAVIKDLQQEDFWRLNRRFYFAGNLVVAVAGKIQIDQIGDWTQKYFAPLTKTGQKITKGINIKQAEPRLRLITKKTEQAHFCLGLPGYSIDHPDRYALAVLATVLGGGFGSRLFSEIREKRGLAYYVDCSPEYFTDSGYLVGRAGVKLKKVSQAIGIVKEEFAKLAAKKVGIKELRRAKEFNKGALILSLEDSYFVADRALAKVLIEGQYTPPQQSLAMIDRVTAEDVYRVAKDVFRPEKLNLAIIGPYEDESPFKKLLK